MAQINDLGVQQLVEEIKRHKAEIKKHNETLDKLYDALITRAQLQELAEIQYDEIFELAKEGISFSKRLSEGDVITADWVQDRDDIVKRAQAIIESEEESEVSL